MVVVGGGTRRSSLFAPSNNDPTTSDHIWPCCPSALWSSQKELEWSVGGGRGFTGKKEFPHTPHPTFPAQHASGLAEPLTCSYARHDCGQQHLQVKRQRNLNFLVAPPLHPSLAQITSGLVALYCSTVYASI